MAAFRVLPLLFLIILSVAGCRNLTRQDAIDIADREIHRREGLPADRPITAHAVHHFGRWVVTARFPAGDGPHLLESHRVVTITDKGDIHEYLAGHAAESAGAEGTKP